MNKKARQLNSFKIKASQQGLTRARAERLISQQWDTLTDEQHAQLAAHKNNHVKVKLAVKLAQQKAQQG